jgi:hypothetical protein
MCECTIIARELKYQIHHTWNAHSFRLRRDFRKVRTREKFVSLSLFEGGCCRSETKHNRRTMPNPNLLVWKRRLPEQKSQPQKTVLGSNPGKYVFCSSETKNDKRRALRPKFSITGKIIGTKTETSIKCPGF